MKRILCEEYSSVLISHADLRKLLGESGYEVFADAEFRVGHSNNDTKHDVRILRDESVRVEWINKYPNPAARDDDDDGDDTPDEIDG